MLLRKITLPILMVLIPLFANAKVHLGGPTLSSWITYREVINNDSYIFSECLYYSKESKIIIIYNQKSNFVRLLLQIDKKMPSNKKISCHVILLGDSQQHHEFHKNITFTSNDDGQQLWLEDTKLTKELIKKLSSKTTISIDPINFNRSFMFNLKGYEYALDYTLKNIK